MVEGTKEASRRHWVRWLTLGGGISFLTLVGSSCAYDKNKPCGDDLVVEENSEGEPRCVCPPGTLYTPTGCTKCGENEILQGTMCVCEEGFVKDAAGNCVEGGGSGGASSTGTGTSTGTSTGTNSNSNSTGNDTSTTGSSGAAGAGGEGGEGSEDSTTDGGTTTGGGTTGTETATSSTTGTVAECTVNDDCDAGEICDAEACRIPTGFGDACAVPTDCTQEASFCDFIQYKCTVQNCTLDPDSCPAEYDCCDLSGFGLPALCIPAGACTT